MIGDNGRKDDEDFDDDDDLDEEDDLDEDAMPDIGGETVIDLSGELADELAADSKKGDPDELARKREIRRRLEDIAEKRNKDLDDTFNFDLDDDL